MRNAIEAKAGVWGALFSASQPKEAIVKKAIFCSDNGVVSKRDAAKIRVEVRRLINAGTTSTHEICEALKQPWVIAFGIWTVYVLAVPFLE